MNIETLYIIGNGFDLWHDLPTRYMDFYKFSSNQLDELEDYILIPNDKFPWWHNFEQNLGKFNWGAFYDENNFIDASDDSFKLSMIYGLEDDLSEQSENMITQLRDEFYNWVKSIHIENTKKKFNFKSNGQFINFNYTSLLQEIYKIPENLIFHIHGSVKNHDNLIFGHGEIIEELPELDENGDSNRHPFSDAEGAAKSFFYEFKKPVIDILNRNSNYFESLKSVKNIVVLGHSLNDIDLPYFEKIFSNLPDSKWIVSQYSMLEGKKHINQLEKCGISSDKITISFIEEIPNHFAFI